MGIPELDTGSTLERALEEAILALQGPAAPGQRVRGGNRVEKETVTHGLSPSNSHTRCLNFPSSRGWAGSMGSVSRGETQQSRE